MTLRAIFAIFLLYCPIFLLSGKVVKVFDGELFVKRFKKRPHLALISDNKDYEPIKIEENLNIDIIGRVVGSYSINSKRF